MEEVKKLNGSALTTIEEMITDRGFGPLKQVDEFLFIAEKAGEKILVDIKVFIKFKLESIKEILLLMENLKIDHAISVYELSVTSNTKKELDNLKNIDIELFKLKNLMYNPVRHYLVPKHERSDEKIKGIIPLILKNDPICRYYNFKEKELIKITRKSGIVVFRRVF